MSILANNKDVNYKFEKLDTYEAGIVLHGPEVKSVKHKQINLKGSFIRLEKDNTLWLVGAHISPYKPAAAVQKDYNTTRPRKLLLQKKELNTLRGKLAQKGLTVVPTKVYTTRALIKVEIALVRGLKKHDKRERLKKKAIEMDVKRDLRGK